MNEADNLFKRVVGNQTDHGGMRLGDVIVLILNMVLMVYSAYWSWHFMQAPLPESDKAVALVGLWGLDVGALFWSLTWIFGSTTWEQDAVSLTMFVIDLIGMTVTSFVGSLGLAATVASADVSRWVVAAIIMLNIVMGFGYHMTSPQTRAARKRRKALEEIAQKEHEAAIAIERERMELEAAERMLEQRKALIEREREAVQQTIELDGIKAGLDEALKSRRLTEDISKRARADVESAVDVKNVAAKGTASGNGNLQQRALNTETELPNA
jgi:hypothetical protein